MKKVLALVLALVMILSLAACGAKTETPKTDDTTKVETPVETPKDETPKDETPKDEGPKVPELKGPGNVTLKRLGYNIAMDPNENIAGKVIEERTGYHVEYFKLPAENADEKLLMEVSGGGNYDIVNANINQYRTLLAQGALQPLDDLLEVYGQAILAGGHSEAVWDALRGEDGKIYGVPYMYPHPEEIAAFMTARMDLLRAAGIEKVPTTIDEFYNMLVTLKKHYGDEYIIFAGPYMPNSEGNENWVIPKTIACAFGIYSDWMVVDGKVIYMTEHENFDDMIAFFTKLQAEGLTDPDWALNTDATLLEKFTSGRSIITCGNRTLVSRGTEALFGATGIGWDDIDYISALQGPDGTCQYMSTEAFNFVSCIPKSSKNAADVMNWWNLRIQDDLFLTIGEEGVHFTYDEKGGINPINPIFADERGQSHWYMDVSTATWGTEQWPARVRKSAGQWHAFSRVTMNSPDYIEFMPNTFAFMPAKENYTTYNGTLFNDLNDYILQVMAGTRSIDDLATFKSDWANAGGEDVRADLQGWYDEFYG